MGFDFISGHLIAVTALGFSVHGFQMNFHSICFFGSKIHGFQGHRGLVSMGAVGASAPMLFKVVGASTHTFLTIFPLIT